MVGLLREAALPQSLLAGTDEVSRVRVLNRAKRSEMIYEMPYAAG
jgi:hypothetical protein